MAAVFDHSAIEFGKLRNMEKMSEIQSFHIGVTLGFEVSKIAFLDPILSF